MYYTETSVPLKTNTKSETIITTAYRYFNIEQEPPDVFA